MLGAGGWSDGKLTYHTEIGGQLSKYCGEDKAMDLMKQVVDNFTRFHPKPEEISLSDPQLKNLNLLNHILDYVYFQYGILVQIIYMKLLKLVFIFS